MQDYIGRILYDESKGWGVCRNVWYLWDEEAPNGQPGTRIQLESEVGLL